MYYFTIYLYSDLPCNLECDLPFTNGKLTMIMMLLPKVPTREKEKIENLMGWVFWRITYGGFKLSGRMESTMVKLTKSSKITISNTSNTKRKRDMGNIF